MDTLFRFRVTDRFSHRELWTELLGEDSPRGLSQARWTMFAMASGMGFDPDRVELESVEL
jgi:hypothetical protein